MKSHYLTQDQFAEFTKHTGCQVCKGPFFTKPKAHSIGDTVVPEGTMCFLLSTADSATWDIVFIVPETKKNTAVHSFQPVRHLGDMLLPLRDYMMTEVHRNDVAVGHKQDDAGFYHSDPAFARRPSRVYRTHKSTEDGYMHYHEGVECFIYEWEQVGEMLTTNAPIMKLTVIDSLARKPIRSCTFDAGKQSF